MSLKRQKEKEPVDLGLKIHRILQYVATLSLSIITAVILGSMSTWDQLKANSVRMESVPGDVRVIREKMDVVSGKVDNHEWRLGRLEKRSDP